MKLPRGLLKRLIREGYSAPEAMKEAWRRVRKNPGAKWHGKEATRAEAARWSSEESGRVLGAHYYRGKRDAHRESQDESRRIGMNPPPSISPQKAARLARNYAKRLPRVGRGADLAPGLVLYHDAQGYYLVGRDLPGFPPFYSMAVDYAEGKRAKTNPGAAWHEGQETLSEDLGKKEQRAGRSARYYEGMADAHRLSAHESRKLGMNPDAPLAVRYVTSRRVFEIKTAEGRTIRLSRKTAVDRLSPTLMEKALTYPNAWVEFRQSNPRRPSRARYVHERLEPKGRFDPRSFRTVQSGDALVTVGCPKGQWDAKRKRCRVGTRAQRIMRPMGRNQLTRKEAGRNPIAVYNPPRGRLIYGRAVYLQGEKTNGSYKGKQYRHTFENDSRVAIYGLPDGSVLLRSAAGKRLWQNL